MKLLVLFSFSPDMVGTEILATNALLFPPPHEFFRPLQKLTGSRACELDSPSHGFIRMVLDKSVSPKCLINQELPRSCFSSIFAAVICSVSCVTSAINCSLQVKSLVVRSGIKHCPL